MFSPSPSFYSHNSSFIHGGIDGGGGSAGGSGDPVRGQHEIHQKIMQLNFRDCHAKIRQVDAHATLGNGVVVQVRRRISCFIISIETRIQWKHFNSKSYEKRVLVVQSRLTR